MNKNMMSKGTICIICILVLILICALICAKNEGFSIANSKYASRDGHYYNYDLDDNNVSRALDFGMNREQKPPMEQLKIEYNPWVVGTITKESQLREFVRPTSDRFTSVNDNTFNQCLSTMHAEGCPEILKQCQMKHIPRLEACTSDNCKGQVMWDLKSCVGECMDSMPLCQSLAKMQWNRGAQVCLQLTQNRYTCPEEAGLFFGVEPLSPDQYDQLKDRKSKIKPRVE